MGGPAVTATLGPGAAAGGTADTAAPAAGSGAADGTERPPDMPHDGTPVGPRHDLPVLEAYRGIAALMVLVTHVGFSSGAGVTGTWRGWLSRLDFGVALFFLLSGFLLFRPYVQAAYAQRPRVAVRDYLRRRYVRLYPAFAITLLAVWFLLPDSRDKPTSLWVQTFFMVQNYFTAFGEQLPGLVQTWSLVIEVSFYVSLPLLALLVLGRGSRLATAGTVQPREPEEPRSRRAARRQRSTPRRRRLASRFQLPPHLQPYRPAIMLAALFVGSSAWRLIYMMTSEGFGRELLWLPAFIDWFVAGMALAWLRERPFPVPEALRYLANTPGVCLSMALALYWLTTTRLGGPYDLVGATTGEGVFKHFLYAVIATLLLLPGVLGDPAAEWRRHAVHPVMRWLGQISFGVFLWHPLLMELIREALDYPVFGGGFWVTLVLTTIASLGVATLSWRFVEEPAQRRFRNGFRRTAARAPRERLQLGRLPVARKLRFRRFRRRRGAQVEVAATVTAE
jgi:peptidoglycan/LPS O-acetylase OafA/YrhL